MIPHASGRISKLRQINKHTYDNMHIYIYICIHNMCISLSLSLYTSLSLSLSIYLYIYIYIYICLTQNKPINDKCLGPQERPPGTPKEAQAVT